MSELRQEGEGTSGYEVGPLEYLTGCGVPGGLEEGLRGGRSE